MILLRRSIIICKFYLVVENFALLKASISGYFKSSIDTALAVKNILPSNEVVQLFILNYFSLKLGLLEIFKPQISELLLLRRVGDMSLPPGFRFHPTDVELVEYFLKRKVDGLKIELEVIPVIDLYKFDPWELPEKSFLPKRDMEWFFFCPRNQKYPNGSRTNRSTSSGYWKASGKDIKIICESSIKGLRKTLFFYRGRAPGGERTDWAMHEYRLYEDLPQGNRSFLGAFALCRVVKRSDHLHQLGEAKAKMALPSSTSEVCKRKCSSKVINLVDLGNDAFPEAFSNGNSFEVAQYMPDACQTKYQSPLVLTDASKIISLEEDIFEQIFPTSFPTYSTETCQTNGISPVASCSSFTDEACNVEEDGRNGFASTSPSPMHCMNFYFNEENMSVPGFEAWNPMIYTPLCRQASADEPNLCSQEDGLQFVI